MKKQTYLLLIILVVATFPLMAFGPQSAPLYATALVAGRTYDQAHSTGYMDWSGSVIYQNLYHEDWSSLPPSEGGTFCLTGCMENVTRINSGGVVSGTFDRDVTYFEVMLAYEYSGTGVGSAIITACTATLTQNLKKASASPAGFNSFTLSVPAGCRTWSVQATGGFVHMRSADVEYVVAIPTATSTRTPTPTSTRTSIPTSTRTSIPTSTRTSIPTSTRTSIPTSTRTPTPTSTRTPVPTSTRTPIPTSTRTFTPTATATNAPPSTFTFTPTFTQTATSTMTATGTLIPTNTPTATATSTLIPTDTPIATYTDIPTPTGTFVPTDTPIPTDTPVVIDTFVPTDMPSATSTGTLLPTFTFTPTFTPSATSTGTLLPTFTFTPTFTPSATSTGTLLPTFTFTPTSTGTLIPTATQTSTATATATTIPTSIPVVEQSVVIVVPNIIINNSNTNTNTTGGGGGSSSGGSGFIAITPAPMQGQAGIMIWGENFCGGYYIRVRVYVDDNQDKLMSPVEGVTNLQIFFLDQNYARLGSGYTVDGQLAFCIPPVQYGKPVYIDIPYLQQFATLQIPEQPEHDLEVWFPGEPPVLPLFLP